MRSELNSIEAGFDKLPTMTGSGGEVVAVNSGGTALEAITTTGTGSGVRATSPTLVTPNIGTPSAGTLTNCTGLPVSSGMSGLGTGVGTFLAAPSSANLAAAVTDETGTGALVFASSPTLVTPALGTPASGDLRNCSMAVAPAIGGTTPAAVTATALNASSGNVFLQQGTAVESTSGAAIDYTGLPSGVKVIVINMAGISLSGTSPFAIVIGDSGGFETSGYVSTCNTLNSTPAWTITTSTAKFLISGTMTAVSTWSGTIYLRLVDSATNLWSISGIFARDGSTPVAWPIGYKALSATLDRVRLTTDGGADTFDAGTVNIQYKL
jgi:hypothetical protein